MAKLTRKVWVGIGVATITGASVTATVVAQGPGHSHQAKPTPSAQQGPAGEGAGGEGGEAYLTDGGPKDTRIRFYRDVELMRGHLLVGQQLIELELWDEALPHFLHPTEELYGLMEKYIKLHRIQPFSRDLQALAQAVKAKRKGAYEQALKVVDRKLDAALRVAKKFMTPTRNFTARSAVEVLRAAQSEYASSMEDGKFVKPVEYQDSRGFVWQAERMFEDSASDLARVDKDAFAKIRVALAKLKTAWPAPMPPDKPVLDAGQIAALVSDVELHISRY
jgi:hypothetical protein